MLRVSTKAAQVVTGKIGIDAHVLKGPNSPRQVVFLSQFVEALMSAADFRHFAAGPAQ